MFPNVKKWTGVVEKYMVAPFLLAMNSLSDKKRARLLTIGDDSGLMENLFALTATFHGSDSGTPEGVRSLINASAVGKSLFAFMHEKARLTRIWAGLGEAKCKTSAEDLEMAHNFVTCMADWDKETNWGCTKIADLNRQVSNAATVCWELDDRSKGESHLQDLFKDIIGLVRKHPKLRDRMQFNLDGKLSVESREAAYLGTHLVFAMTRYGTRKQVTVGTFLQSLLRVWLSDFQTARSARKNLEVFCELAYALVQSGARIEQGSVADVLGEELSSGVGWPELGGQGNRAGRQGGGGQAKLDKNFYTQMHTLVCCTSYLAHWSVSKESNPPT